MVHKLGIESFVHLYGDSDLLSDMHQPTIEKKKIYTKNRVNPFNN